MKDFFKKDLQKYTFFWQSDRGNERTAKKRQVQQGCQVEKFQIIWNIFLVPRKTFTFNFMGFGH